MYSTGTPTWTYAPLAVGHISLGDTSSATTAFLARVDNSSASGSLADITGELKNFKIDGGTY